MRVFVGVCVITALLVGTLIVYRGFKPSQASRLKEASVACERKDFGEALRLCELVLQTEPDSHDARFIGGRAARELKLYHTALKHLRKIELNDSTEAVEAQFLCGNISLQLFRLTDAERYLRQALEQDPEHVEANANMVFVLRLEGRNQEAVHHVHQLLRHGRFESDYLSVAGTLEATWIDPARDVPFLNACRSARPNDPVWALGLIRRQISEHEDLENAVQSLQAMVRQTPELLQAQATLGQLLLEIGAHDDWLEWHSNLPETANQQPTIWVTRARWAHANGQKKSAIRCLWEAIRRYPNDRAPNLMLANLLVSAGRTSDARRFQQRGMDLQAFDDLLLRSEMTTEGLPNAESISEMIATLERLGRLWEALGWSKVLLRINAASESASNAIVRLEKRLEPSTPLTLASANPALMIDLSDFPLPQWPAASSRPQPSGESASAASRPSFRNVASMVDLDFTYLIEERRRGEQVHTFDFAGGGIGVIDCDLDLRPDIYLTQSRPLSGNSGEHEPTNRLFRNIRGTRFSDVTGATGLGDKGFGQGAAVGDINNDGFPDIYVTNVGQNRMFRNNGDGTFSDHTNASGTAGDHFSLGAVLADVNGDGTPDLYVVNYLGGDAMTRQCGPIGERIQCTPHRFPGQQDRLYVGGNSGQFMDVTQASGIADPESRGKGMAVIAANLDQQPGLEIYVANDGTANFLFTNETRSVGQAVRFKERGDVSGTAYDDLGRLQGSMGIAVADVNADGLTDLFVTNFYKEDNNMFLRQSLPTILFNDAALESGLSHVSNSVMGWGTQFLDAELDGDWDLIVANGHLDHATAGTDPSVMPTQFIRNNGHGKFRTVPPEEVGPYFAERFFGRAVARLDWNCDGADDVCITHMDAPVALLTNEPETAGRFITMWFHGVESSRDAIGVTVQVVFGDNQRTVQLIGGGGFEAENQRTLTLGLGTAKSIDHLDILWPSGSQQTHDDLETNRSWTFVEGRSAALVTD